jgi:hypothetical protein
VFLGWLQIRRDSVWPATIAHSAANTVLEALDLVLFVARPGYGDLLLSLRGMFVVVPMTAIAAWILATGRLRQGPTPVPEAGERTTGLTAFRRRLHKPGTIAILAGVVLVSIYLWPIRPMLMPSPPSV